MWREEAYTLLELMAALFLSLCLCTGAGLYASEIHEGRRLTLAAKETLSRLGHFGAMAEISGLEYRISFRSGASGGPAQMTVESAASTAPSEAEAPSLPAPPTSVKEWRLPDGVTVTKASFASLSGRSATLVLRPDGSASPGSIELRSGSRRLCTITQALRGARRLKCKDS